MAGWRLWSTWVDLLARRLVDVAGGGRNGRRGSEAAAARRVGGDDVSGVKPWLLVERTETEGKVHAVAHGGFFVFQTGQKLPQWIN